MSKTAQEILDALPLPPIHSSVTPERLTEALTRYQQTLDNPGFCLSCGAEAEGCEPDARRYHCDECGQPAVFGAEELVLMTM
jgi:hypothetical protein